MEYKKNCLNCDKPFTSPTRRALYCSDYCRVDFNRKKNTGSTPLPKSFTQVEKIKFKKTTTKSFDAKKNSAAKFDEVVLVDKKELSLAEEIALGVQQRLNNKKNKK